MPAPQTTRVMVVEDHKMFQEGLRVLLDGHEDFDLVATFDTGSDALQYVRERPPEVGVVDLTLPDGEGTEVIRECAQLGVCGAVALSVHESAEHVHAAFRAGALAYVNKSSASRDLIEAIRAVIHGELYADSLSARALAESYGRRLRPTVHDRGYESLSDREREVFALIASGCTTKEIAHRLRLSPKTIETHRLSIYSKLELDSPVAVARYAASIGLI